MEPPPYRQMTADTRKYFSPDVEPQNSRFYPHPTWSAVLQPPNPNTPLLYPQMDLSPSME